MKKRTAFIGAILSLLPLGQPLLIKSGLILSTTGLLLSVPEKVKAESFKFYFDRAYEKGENGDYYGAISDFTKAIEINPNDEDAYYNRGWNKSQLKDYYGAISDFTKAIEINPKDGSAYYNRGNAKSDINDHYGAISDYTKAIEINPNYINAYFNRSMSKEIIGDMNGACFDAKKVVSLGDEDPDNESWIRNNC